MRKKGLKFPDRTKKRKLEDEIKETEEERKEKEI